MTSPSRAIGAVIFDCDGTLVDSLPIVRDVLREYLQTLDLGVPLHQATAVFGSGRLADSVAALERMAARSLPPDFIDRLLERRDAAVRGRLRAMEGAAELITGLGLPVAVASNAPLPQTRLSLEVTGLIEYFGPHVYSAHEFGRWKPDPGLFLFAAEQLGVVPEQCAVVEDSALGAEAGLAAGMTVFALCDDVSRMPAGVRSIGKLSALPALLIG